MSDDTVSGWAREQLDVEIKRLQGLGVKVLPVPVLRVALEIERPEDVPKLSKEELKALRKAKKPVPITAGRNIVNYIQANSSFDFNRVTQIMVSASKPCDARAGWRYVTLLLRTSPNAGTAATAAPMLALPYTYAAGPEYSDNTLQHWKFENKDEKTARHVVDELTDA